MADHAPGIDLVVVNYKTHRELTGFLHSLEQHPPSRPWHLSIVNVAPDDIDKRVGEKWRHRYGGCAQHLVFVENVGYNHAANYGGSHGRHEVVAVFNADVELSEGALDTVADELLANPDWAIAGPRQVDDAHRLTAAGVFGTLAAPRHRDWHRPDTGQATDVRGDAVYVAGAAMFFRRAVWDELTACPIHQEQFPESCGPLGSMHHYYGDTAAAYEAHSHGYRCGYVGTATIKHRWHSASPLGGLGEQSLGHDRALFRRFCAAHGVPCD